MSGELQLELKIVGPKQRIIRMIVKGRMMIDKLRGVATLALAYDTTSYQSLMLPRYSRVTLQFVNISPGHSPLEWFYCPPRGSCSYE